MKFNINEIPDPIAKNMVSTSVWKKECPVGIERLKLLEVSHYNFVHTISTGQLIVLDKISQAVLNIFEELLVLKFPINSIKTMDEFRGNDELSMATNNSSCFNFRPINGTDKLSMHSYGLAIDINPVQNPFIMIDKTSNNIKVLPEQSVDFLNRHNKREGMVEPIVEIFRKYGFSEWGGNWNTPIDYHHFQVPRKAVAELIA